MIVNKNLKEVFNDLKDFGYSIKEIDNELCLYKDFDFFDIEGSCLNNSRTKNTANVIYVWWKKHLRYANIYCSNTEETKEVCNFLDKAESDFKKTGNADYPFNLLFKEPSHETLYIISKNNDIWTINNKDMQIENGRLK